MPSPTVTRCDAASLTESTYLLSFFPLRRDRLPSRDLWAVPPSRKKRRRYRRVAPPPDSPPSINPDRSHLLRTEAWRNFVIRMSWSVVNDGDGLPRIILTEPAGSSAVIHLYGGQVLSWKNEKREELLFVSTKTSTKSPKPFRGGIPICFPQFDNLGYPERHGFARNRLWELDTCPSPLPRSNNHSSVDLILKSTDEDLKTWPHSFELRLRVILHPSKLTLIPRVRNTGSKDFSFTFAIQNYLSMSDVSEIRVEGLETLDYFDNLENGERFTEQGDALTFDGEVDRVYLRTPAKIAIIDHEKKQTLVLRKECLPDAGVWNPWNKKAKALPDFGDEDYKAMLCIDSAVAETPVVLKPLEEWRGCQELSVVSSSYCSGQLDPRIVLHG